MNVHRPCVMGETKSRGSSEFACIKFTNCVMIPPTSPLIEQINSPLTLTMLLAPAESSEHRAAHCCCDDIENLTLIISWRRSFFVFRVNRGWRWKKSSARSSLSRQNNNYVTDDVPLTMNVKLKLVRNFSTALSARHESCSDSEFRTSSNARCLQREMSTRCEPKWERVQSSYSKISALASLCTGTTLVSQKTSWISQNRIQYNKRVSRSPPNSHLYTI